MRLFSSLTLLTKRSRSLMTSPSGQCETEKVSGVFKSLPSILSFLDDYKEEKEVAELLQIHDKYSNTTLPKSTTPLQPFIVFEGLDGAGKSLLTKLTKKKLKATQAGTPPESVQHLRPYFDKKGVDRVLRRAFYSLGNYIAANEVRKILVTTPVVMDRFWSSTAAYAIAELTEPNDLPEDLFTWPSDLLQPDLIVFLTVSEEVRLERMSRRKTFTAEEDQLKENASYRKLLTETFRKMKEPSLKFVNCDGVPNRIVQTVLSLLDTEARFERAP